MKAGSKTQYLQQKEKPNKKLVHDGNGRSLKAWIKYFSLIRLVSISYFLLGHLPNVKFDGGALGGMTDRFIDRERKEQRRDGQSNPVNDELEEC